MRGQQRGEARTGWSLPGAWTLWPQRLHRLDPPQLAKPTHCYPEAAPGLFLPRALELACTAGEGLQRCQCGQSSPSWGQATGLHAGPAGRHNSCQAGEG